MVSIMITQYALIRNNVIEKIRDVVADDPLLISKLTAHDYRIIEEQVTPVHDPITQTLTLKYTIQADKVVKSWIVAERLFNEAVVAKQNDVETQAVSKIKEFFNAADQNAKVSSVLAVKDAAIVSIKAAKTNAELRTIKPVFPEAVQIEP